MVKVPAAKSLFHFEVFGLGLSPTNPKLSIQNIETLNSKNRRPNIPNP